MPYYKDKNLLFIHIPKTGGTVIETDIEKHAKQTLYSSYTNTLLDFPFNKKSLQHQFYTTIYQFRDKLNVNFDNIKIFSVVRNPYDRIISDLIYLKLIQTNFTAQQVYDTIKNNYLYRDDLDNHNQPQYKFIVDENSELIKNIKIFNTETLNQSNDNLNNFLGFNINIKQNRVKDYSKYLNKDSISLINTFYKKDFELFNYKLKSAS
tara:strand:+ start:3319 stop:3939 length:621 start_codon:yes stop_codon:yes gene_type:complete